MGKRCIYVASGPSAVYAQPLPGWDLVTLNRALCLFPTVDLACFGTGRKLEETQEDMHRAKQIALAGDIDVLTWPCPAWWPVTRYPQFTPEAEPKGGREALARHIAEGHIVGRGAIYLHVLKELGYTELWLFGHDGGDQRLPVLGGPPGKRGYDKGRFCTEQTLQHLGLTGTFWPHIPEQAIDVYSRASES